MVKFGSHIKKKVKQILEEIGMKLTSAKYVSIMYYIVRNFVGINEIGGGSDRSNVQGNVISVVNAGAGTGNAFDIMTPTDGVIMGNTYAGSDAQGTLALTTGIIVNYDG